MRVITVGQQRPDERLQTLFSPQRFVLVHRRWIACMLRKETLGLLLVAVTVGVFVSGILSAIL